MGTISLDERRREPATVERSRFVEAMRHAASGVTLVTTDGPGGRQGATVSAMCSVSAEPPAVLTCIYGQGRTAAAVAANGVFCVNLLAEAQRLLAEIFAGRVESEPFGAGAWDLLATGAPVLDDAIAAFDCRVAQVIEHGTHSIFIGDVIEVRAGRGLPLVYADRTFCRTMPLARVC